MRPCREDVQRRPLRRDFGDTEVHLALLHHPAQRFPLDRINMTDAFEQDVLAVGSIDAVPTLLDVICRTTGMRFAAVARVTDDRWIACSVLDHIEFGLKVGGELKVETTICHEVRDRREAVVINHVAEDGIYCGHPTPAMYGFQSYISMPIILSDGRFFGTLCAIDPKPTMLKTPQVVGMFKMFAQLIAFHLDAIERVALSEFRLSEERKTSELREQFIAVLGHDLRNPLAGISAATQLLERMQLGERATRITGMIQSTAMRMAGLIEDVLDFARGRLGDGIHVNLAADEPLDLILDQVVAELRVSSPHKTIDAQIHLTEPVTCDQRRIGQMFSNLLGNALAHGNADEPVRVRAATANGLFELWVSNSGAPIPPQMMERLFHPFRRGEVQRNQQGLGLGLYIASEIARAHAGSLSVESTDQQTRFTFRMPIAHQPKNE
jgi:signal transduction histidine kinase